MNEVLIVFASATTASRIKKLLEKEGFYARILQTPKLLSIGGCSFSVKTTEEAIKVCRRFADELSVKIKGVYKITSSGYEDMNINK